ncbi:MAG: hypothetical protein V7K14_13625 [Nostoc sp.]|uniref:hypothetical protein n=1 Tax=unclassified Nostoc TaxID=2593658 RepID=UPI0025F6B0B3|nr:hypothetical protein [Nostoc sp. NMS7]MBN3947172.1 hypothetical protein [Nostoc sp. NMS7]
MTEVNNSSIVDKINRKCGGVGMAWRVHQKRSLTTKMEMGNLSEEVSRWRRYQSVTTVGIASLQKTA